jgi:ABC-type branched-subunit amino acid transport system substrate-binding protein
MRVRFVPLALLLLAEACTGSSVPLAPSASPPPIPPSPSPGLPPLYLDVVAATEASSAGPGAANDQTYLDGMRLAVQVLNADGGAGGRPLELRPHDDGGSLDRSTEVIRSLLDAGSTAILYVGPGPALSPLRELFAQAGTPVILLGGDLYTSRGMFPQVFQTTIPWEWQAKVIAKYLVTDRRAGDVVFVGSGPEASAAATSTGRWLEYWGGSLAGSYLTPPAGASPPSRPASDANAAVVFGTPYDVHAEVAALEAGAHRPRISGGESLLVPVEGFDQPPAGTTACNTYTWSGWAEPIRRVGAFMASFQASAGHPPNGLEQEGYDAIQALAYALGRDGLRGGRALVSALEAIHDRAFSGFPIDLGPDDHQFLPRDELGLFAVPGPNERLDPWQSRTDPDLWRPVMRTFTYDGRRDDILDEDRPVFFPGWRKNQPGPYYWKSRYGIVSKPKDPVH